MWKIGITTAPRRQMFLDQTILTLLNAGWDVKDIFVMAEPGSPRSAHNVEWIENKKRLGAYANWYQLMQHLFLATTTSQYLVACQDDVSVWKGLKTHLESLLSPGKTAVYQPYTSAIESRANKGWYRCRAGRALCGAHFFVFPRDVMDTVMEIIPSAVPENKHIDGYLAQALNDHGIPFYQHIPSLAQHLGDAFSTLGYRPDPSCRIAPDYIGINGDLEPPAST